MLCLLNGVAFLLLTGRVHLSYVSSISRKLTEGFWLQDWFGVCPGRGFRYSSLIRAGVEGRNEPCGSPRLEEGMDEQLSFLVSFHIVCFLSFSHVEDNVVISSSHVCAS